MKPVDAKGTCACCDGKMPTNCGIATLPSAVLWGSSAFDALVKAAESLFNVLDIRFDLFALWMIWL